jgi:hypothetical protein
VRPHTTPPVLSAEDEQRPVVGFLRLAGWSDERIVEVVETHKRGEVYTTSITVPAPAIFGDGR